MKKLTKSLLHHTVLNFVLEHGFAPRVETLAEMLEVPPAAVEEGLEDLAEGHGVVLHPKSSKIWVIHPFSLATTNFWVQSARGGWWGNCAWCSLGIAALLEEDCSITTTLGGHDQQTRVQIRGGRVQEDDLLVHFPVPMQNAWDNVIYTCSTMLFFRDEASIENWCVRHGVPKGDVQPIEKIWEFSKVWYGNHASPEWTKWTVEEARELFSRFELTGPIWEVKTARTRF